MNSDTSAFGNTNEIIAQSKNLFELLDDPSLNEKLRELEYDWTTRGLDPTSPVTDVLRELGYLDEDAPTPRASRLGELFISRLLINFELGEISDRKLGNLSEKYTNFHVLSSGKNSIIIKAEHRFLGSRVVLKLLRPGASKDITKSLRLLARLPRNSAIVLPQDFLRTKVSDVFGKDVELDCLVFPFVEGITFRKFLQHRNHHLNSQIAMSYVRQVAGALRELESLGAYHGDLHDENILIEASSSAGIRFRIVDISFDSMGSLPLETCKDNDVRKFKQLLWRLLAKQRASTPKMSLRKYIGTQNWLKIEKILSEPTNSFKLICSEFKNDDDYSAYLRKKSSFIERAFEAPISFRLQRYEEITDPRVAVELFVPFDQLIKKIKEFGNVYVSGNRGSGKSTYLASLAYLPGANSSVVDHNETFGVYFPCRQGEFRALEGRANWDAELTRELTASILFIKIVRRTIETIASGVTSKELQAPADLHRLREFVSQYVPEPGIISVETELQSELDNLVATAVRVEMDEIASLQNATVGLGPRGPQKLIEFFEILRESFPELASARFHLLFDDAGSPYIPENVQAAINDLILTSNPLFCVKLSAEKLTFEFRSSSGKILEVGQDYLEHDISQILFIGAQGSSGLPSRELEQYFRRIVEQRLLHFRYQSSDITDYLGDRQLSAEQLQDLLANQSRQAHYAGWTTVWNIADRTPRNLLELVSEIFVVSEIKREESPRVASAKAQDRAIRTISDKRLESLSQISGTIEIDGQRISLGRQLFETTTAIGSTFRKYLSDEKNKRRKRQYLAIERNDLAPLKDEADLVLRKLITFGIVDAGRSGYARDDKLRKPFYVLNRIYCPAFSIGYQRDMHLRLSTGKLELLLTRPAQFARFGTKRLQLDQDNPPDLFNYRGLD